MLIAHDGFSKENSSQSIHNSINRYPSIIYGWGNGAKSNYPAWILNERNFTKLVLSTTRSTLMSVGKPTEGNLGLVREKRGGREVGTVAYPTSLSSILFSSLVPNSKTRLPFFPCFSLQTPNSRFI